MNTFESITHEVGIRRPYGYHFYFKNYIFKNIDLNNKKILDIGGGNGLASFFALSSSLSCKAWVVDPIAEGSNQLMFEQFNSMKRKYDTERIVFHRDFIDTLLEPELFDIILMHNTINHIGEDILTDINEDETAYNEYKNRLKTILDRLRPGGKLIIADCGRYNFIGNLGLKNPLAPSIDWKLHCEPSIWKSIIEEIGFKHSSTRWTARRETGVFGKIFLANRLCSYFLNSHFVSNYEKN